MSVTIKSEHEIGLMREAGRLLAIMHEELQKEIKPGMSTWDITWPIRSSVILAVFQIF